MKLKASLYIVLLLQKAPYFQLNAQNYINNWPNWCGPNADGVSLNGNRSIEWSETKNIKWEIPQYLPLLLQFVSFTNDPTPIIQNLTIKIKKWSKKK